jgi:hypothetical protein
LQDKNKRSLSYYFLCNDSECHGKLLVNVMLGHPVITFTTLVRLGRLNGKMFVRFNHFLSLTHISLRFAIQETKFCSTVGALLWSHQLFGVVDSANGYSLGFVLCCRIYRL